MKESSVSQFRAHTTFDTSGRFLLSGTSGEKSFPPTVSVFTSYPSCSNEAKTRTARKTPPTMNSMLSSHQVLTAIYPAPTVALATGVVSVANVPPAVATPAQDMMDPSSPMATGVQGLAVATPPPTVPMEVEVKREVKREGQSDGQAEDGGYGSSSCAASSSCAVNATAGNASLGFLIFTQL